MNAAFLSMLLAPAALFAAQPVMRPVAFDAMAGGNSTTPLLSGSAQGVYFVSDAPNLLSPAVTSKWVQVYRQDRVSGNVTLVSVNVGGGAADGNCALAGISTNGQLVAFFTDAPDVVPGDANKASDLFLRDLETEATRWITRPIEETSSDLRSPTGLGAVFLGEDGQWLFFECAATNLTSEADLNLTFDVFAHHIPSGTNQLVARSTAHPGSTLTAGARLLSATPDGAKVAFLTASQSEIDPALTRSQPAVFIRDMNSGITTWASQLDAFFSAEYSCVKAALSGNGGVLAIVASASSQPAMLFRTDLSGGSTVLITTNVDAARTPLISRDGQVVVFEDGTNVYRWTATGGVVVVNTTTDGLIPSVGQSMNAAMTPDGNHVCFCSDSAGLTPGMTGGVFQIYCRDLAMNETWLVTQTPDQQASAEATRDCAIDIAADGSIVAFDSRAGDLAPSDQNRSMDVFVRVRDNSAVSPFSLRSAMEQRQTALGSTIVQPGCLSSNGVQLAIANWDTDGVAGDTNRLLNAFAANVQSGTFALAFSNDVRSMAISGDGRYIAAYTTSRASGSNMMRLSRFDLQSGSEVVLAERSYPYVPPIPAISSDGNIIVSTLFSDKLNVYNVASATNEYWWNVPANPLPNSPPFVDAIISADSRFVVFYARSGDLYLSVYDRVTSATHTVMHGAITRAPALSGNSKYLVCEVTQSGVSNTVFRHDMATTVNAEVGQNMRNLSVSHDGRLIAGETVSANLSSPWEIVLLDCETKQSSLISVSASGEPGNGRSQRPVISADGRYIAYLTDSPLIVPGNTPYRRQVVLRDTLLGTTALLSAATTGAPGNNHSSQPFMSADGRTIVFQSMASNLTPGDYNNAADIFVVKLGREDSDGDGMDDDWEAGHFGNLAHDGNGDTDGDGMSDRAEFVAETDPTNNGSVFRVYTMARVGEAGQTLIWNGNPGRAYRVEYKDDLSAAEWTPLSAPISWSANTGRADDPAAPAQRFYRVVRLP